MSVRKKAGQGEGVGLGLGQVTGKVGSELEESRVLPETGTWQPPALYIFYVNLFTGLIEF